MDRLHSKVTPKFQKKSWIGQRFHKFYRYNILRQFFAEAKTRGSVTAETRSYEKIRRFFIDEKISNEKRAASWVLTDAQENVLALLPYLFSYLSIEQETDKIHYILLYKYRK